MERAARRTSPVPAHVAQFEALVPGTAPVPPHVVQRSRVRTFTLLVVPLATSARLRFGGFLLARRNAVGMMLHREPTVGLLDLAFVRVALDPEDAVVVALHPSSSPTRRLV